MASTNSLGLTAGATSSSEAQEYYRVFQEALKDVRRRIEAAKGVDELQAIVESIAGLRTTLTDKTAVLPKYDQQTHEHNLRAVQTELAEKRTQLVPKSRFAFKRKERATATVAAPTQKDDGPPLSDAHHVRTPTENVTASSYRCIRDRRREVLSLASSDGSGTSTDLHLNNLQDCIIDLRERDGVAIAALQIRSLERCVVLAGKIEGSVMVHECRGCAIVLACRQYRMHTSSDIAAFVSTGSIATIEHATNITFAPNDDGSPVRVQDFNHISTLTSSANWTSMTLDAANAMRHTLHAPLTLHDLPALLTRARLST